MKRILLIGNGAREHAIAEAVVKSPQDIGLYSIMSAKNPGILKLSDQIKITDLDNLPAIEEFVRLIEPHMAVIGPEAPLMSGIVDLLEKMGVPSVGPKKALARLETSKGYLRELMKKNDIPGLPQFRVFKNKEGLADFLKSLDGFVVKPDGLTGGKGVKVQGEHLHSVQDAVDYCEEIFSQDENAIVEEKLIGEEFSLQCFTDGYCVIPCPVVQDHKRAYVGDKGPNTGGMGSYSCKNHMLPFINEEHIAEAVRITKLVAKALRDDNGEPYKGIMYGGFITTKEGVKLIEYNARFGDPEAMNVLPLLGTDFVDICDAIINSELDRVDVEFDKKATVCKYAVPEGYPTDPVKNKKIDLSLVPKDVKIYYASVDKKEDVLYMSSSRAIAIVGIANTLEEAEFIAERAVKKIKGPLFHREDIGTAELIKKRIEHMEELME